MSSGCPKNSATKEKSDVKRMSTRDMHISVIVGGTQMDAYVDTGSDVTLMKRSIFDSMNIKAQILHSNIVLTGLGQRPQLTSGYFETNISIQNEE